ncbi:hypothetical protein CDQ92_20655 [Sphingopyxis bauzanensis]|uniref:Tn3 transposase DDE domain-containing protein n=1 Tax=Sphingopyxis bauzanensis TaxID=651663 RepID=A0A246JEM5_9SPHN|nr:hypothetical protein CDQ92_20655 [Sphingopyxis bauzanensis]
MLRKLAGFPRQNPVARALREIGRIERTLFMLDWFDDPEQRRRTGSILNKGEARNALARAIFFNRLGELRDRTFENQRHRASGLTLLTAAAVSYTHLDVYKRQACNIGLEPVVRPEFAALRRDRLSWVSQNFIRPETIAAANAAIVAAHSRLDIVQHWGAGEVASADGMRFVAPSSAIHAGPNPKYYGQERGVTWYNMISDQFSGLGGAVIPGTLRDSLVLSLIHI